MRVWKGSLLASTGSIKDRILVLRGQCRVVFRIEESSCFCGSFCRALNVVADNHALCGLGVTALQKLQRRCAARAFFFVRIALSKDAHHVVGGFIIGLRGVYVHHRNASFALRMFCLAQEKAPARSQTYWGEGGSYVLREEFGFYREHFKIASRTTSLALPRDTLHVEEGQDAWKMHTPGIQNIFTLLMESVCAASANTMWMLWKVRVRPLSSPDVGSVYKYRSIGIPAHLHLAIFLIDVENFCFVEESLG